MTKLQIISVVSAVLLFIILYFGCDTVSPEQKRIGEDRKPAMVSTDISVLLKNAAATLDPAQTGIIEM